jgi:hypothetical protein
MCGGLEHAVRSGISLGKTRHNLESALRSVEKPPTLEEVLKQVSTRGVLRGPVDWVFPAWGLYVNYVVKEIASKFRLSAKEEDQLKDFGRRLNKLLEQAERQAKAKLTSIYRAIMEDAYRIEGNKLYAPDGTWMYVRGDFAPRIIFHGVNNSARFPDLLKLPRERLELLQLGWRASDEGKMRDQPYMGTTQPWQVFAWAAVRYGELYTYVASTILTREGTGLEIRIKAKSWGQRWSKDEAVDLVASHLRRGEWAPLLTMWLGDGEARRREVLHGKYKVVVAAKEPWRLGNSISTGKAHMACSLIC